MSIKAKAAGFLRKGALRLKKLASEEERLKRQAKKISAMEDRVAREERLAYVRAEKYKLRTQMENAKTAYLRAKAGRQRASEQTDTALDKASRALTSVFGRRTTTRTTKSGKKRRSVEETITGYKPSKSKKKDNDWNFWD